MIPAILLFLAILPALAISLLARAGVRSGLIGMAAASLSGLTYAAMAAAAWRIPLNLDWFVWDQIAGPRAGEDWLLVDSVSWPLGFALSAVVFSAVLRDLAQSQAVDWRSQAGILGLGGAGLLAVFSGSLPAILLAWTLLDFLELLVIQLKWERGSEPNEVVSALGGRLLGTLAMMAAAALSRDGFLLLREIPAGGGLWVLLAAGLRSGLWEGQADLLPGAARSKGLNVVSRFAPLAGVLMLLVRLGETAIPAPFWPFLLGPGFVAGLVAVRNGLLKRERFAARAHWILGTGSLLFASSVQGMPDAALAWGLSLLIGGCLGILQDRSPASLRWLPAVMAVLMAGLPFSPVWAASRLSGSVFWPWGAIWTFITAGLLAGYALPSETYEPEPQQQYGGQRFLLILPQVLLPVSFFLAGWAPWIWAEEISGGYWEGGVVLLLSAGLAFIAARGYPARVSFLEGFSLRPLLRGLLWLLQRVYETAGRVVTFISRILEGESAVLWAILLLALLISMFSQLGLGN